MRLPKHVLGTERRKVCFGAPEAPSSPFSTPTSQGRAKWEAHLFPPGPASAHHPGFQERNTRRCYREDLTLAQKAVQPQPRGVRSTCLRDSDVPKGHSTEVPASQDGF